MIEVVNFHSCQEVASSIENDANGCIDVCQAGDNNNMNQETLSKEAAVYFLEKQQALNCIASGVFRLVNMRASATAFCIHPCKIASCEHVFMDSAFKYGLLAKSSQLAKISNDADLCLSSEYSEFGIQVALMPCVLENKKLEFNAKEFYWPGTDEIFGMQGDFGDVDFAVRYHNCAPHTNVVFVPSARVAYPGNPFVKISYAGIETDKITPRGAYGEDLLKDFVRIRNAFFGFGKKCISYGKILPPYTLHNDKWVPNAEYVPSTATQHHIYSNESVYGGSSGAVCLLDDFQMHMATTLNGEQLILVEYVGIRMS